MVQGGASRPRRKQSPIHLYSGQETLEVFQESREPVQTIYKILPYTK
jgi:hypothetical protein